MAKLYEKRMDWPKNYHKHRRSNIKKRCGDWLLGVIKFNKIYWPLISVKYSFL